MENCGLIVGLGNPGATYENTRHNIGFKIVKALATKYKISFRSALAKCKGSFGEGEIKDRKILLLLPLTFMNNSGLSVKLCVEYYKIPLDRLLVITDDVALDLGRLRLRLKGSSGGHNGLESVETYLKTQEYPRLRIGVGRKKEEKLADYVLGQFTNEEQQKLKEIEERSIFAIETWLLEGIGIAMNKINQGE